MSRKSIFIYPEEIELILAATTGVTSMVLNQTLTAIVLGTEFIYEEVTYIVENCIRQSCRHATSRVDMSCPAWRCS